MRTWTRIAVTLLGSAAFAGCGHHGASHGGSIRNVGGLYAEGRGIFVSAGCGGCHTVAAARTHGQIGPDFDSSEQLSRDQILAELEAGDGVMPSFKGILTPRQKSAVVEFVYQTMHRRR